jgi:hypothetical protein
MFEPPQTERPPAPEAVISVAARLRAAADEQIARPVKGEGPPKMGSGLPEIGPPGAGPSQKWGAWLRWVAVGAKGQFDRAEGSRGAKLNDGIELAATGDGTWSWAD